MIHHVRFLKLPRVEANGPSSFAIKALITITTDLGDSFLSSRIALSAGLWSDTRLLVDKTRSIWQSGMRSLWIEFTVSKTKQVTWPLRMEISHGAGEQALNVLSLEQLPRVIDICSHPIPAKVGSEVSKRVLRVFQLATGPLLRIHEDTGDSIARHIWDAGIALIACLGSNSRQMLQARCPSFYQVLQPAPSKALKVLELGSGCGIIGIALASIRPNSHVILTDLPDAMELIEDNIAHSQLALGSRLSSMVLDWDRDLPEAITAEQFHLVLVCDCTYNPDSIPALVKTLSALMARSPTVMIVVANKIRHDSEISFFDQMADVGLTEVEQLRIPLDGDYVEETEHAQNIDIHVYFDEKLCSPESVEFLRAR